MCEVNNSGDAGEAPIQADDALERIFTECDEPSTGRVSVAKLIGYMRDRMSTHGSPEILRDLRKSMCAASSRDGEVTREQYYDVSRRWLVKVRKHQDYHESHQDSNNNLHVDRSSYCSLLRDTADPSAPANGGEPCAGVPPIGTTLGSPLPVQDGRVYAAGSGCESGDARAFHGFLDLSTSTVVVVDTAESRSGTTDPFFGDLSSVDGTFHMAVDDPVAETAQDLRLRAHRCAADNDHLREELQRAEDSIATLESQLAAAERKLESANSRCERVQGEHEEQKELLAAGERDREALGARNQRLEKDNSLLRKEIKAVEAEMGRLNSDLDRANERTNQRTGLLARCRQELIEVRALYDEARGQISRMELANAQLREEHEVSTSTAEHLRVVVDELQTRISELQPNQNYVLRSGGLFGSPTSDDGLENEVEIFPDSDNEIIIPRSLRDEMQAYTEYTGAAVDWDGRVRNFDNTTEDQDSNSGGYVEAVRCATRQLERATAELAAQPTSALQVPVTGDEEGIPAGTGDLQRFESQIRHALTVLSLTASRRMSNADTRDAATQLDRLDSAREFTGIASHANNDDNRKLCPACRRENRFPVKEEAEEEEVEEKEEEEGAGEAGEAAAVAAAASVVGASSRATDPSVPPSDVHLMSGLTDTPRRSEREPGSTLPPPEYFCEQAVILPIVAALDDIIKGTTSGRSSNGIWMCRGLTAMEDTSDDTYGTRSSESRSSSSEESDRRPSAMDLPGNANTFESTKLGGSERARNRTSLGNLVGGDDGPDVVQGLNLELERLTLGTGVSDTDRQGAAVTRDRRSSSVTRLRGRVPKRKLSVYPRSADHRGRLDSGRRTIEGEPASSACVEKSIQDPASNESQSATLEDYSESPVKNAASVSSAGERPGPSTTYNVSLTLACPGDIGSRRANFTTEAGALPTIVGGTTELSARGRDPRAVGEGPPHPRPGRARGNEPAESSVELPSGLSFRAKLRGPDIPIWPATVKPVKSRVNLGNRRSEYVIPGTGNPPRPTRTLRRPANGRTPGDVGRSDVAERRSEDRGIPARSRSVERAMSSEEDSSDSECARGHIDRGEDAVQQVTVVPLPPPQTQTSPPPQRQGEPSALLFGDSLPCRGDYANGKIAGVSEENRQRRSKNGQRLRRSLSESDVVPRRGSEVGYNGCSCGSEVARDAVLRAKDPKDRQNPGAFPNLPDVRLIELGLADPSDGDDPCERIGEDELERKYTALSIGLGTDRVTLPRRLALSLRQRDQAERNLATEVAAMQRDIQALAPLCVDRESVVRVERVRHQLEMISRCALRVSCTAELLGATHQERRVSRAALLADRYLQALRARCDKLAAELAETKRILTENNIVVEENPGELIDDLVPRARYRGAPTINRTTMSRRRASIATISRPTTVNTLPEATKDNARQQRPSVPGRMSLRRPSLGYDTQRWDNEKLDRTDSSSSSIGELRDIFEQAESRRGSREESNNPIRSQSSNLSVGSCESGDSDVWASTREDPVSFRSLIGDEETSADDGSLSQRTPWVFRTMRERVSRLPASWYLLFVAIFFFGFYSNRYVTTRSVSPLKWWSIDEIIKRYVRVERNVPPPL